MSKKVLWRKSYEGGLVIFSLNVRSLTKHLDEIKILVEDKRPHIFSLCETQLDDCVLDEKLHLDGYHEIIRRDMNRNSGGVALYIHKSIPYTNRNDLLCDLEICAAQLNIHYVKPILVSSVCRPPHSKVELFDRQDKFISKIEEEGKEFIITGDMNCYIFKPKVYADHHLTLVIAEPTRVTSDTRTLIDHIATNKLEYVSKSGVIACGISDHELVFANRSMRIPKIKKDPKTIDIRKLKSFDSVAFLEELKLKKLIQ